MFRGDPGITLRAHSYASFTFHYRGRTVPFYFPLLHLHLSWILVPPVMFSDRMGVPKHLPETQVLRNRAYFMRWACFALSGIVSTGFIFSTDPEEALRLVLFVAMSDVVQYLAGNLIGGRKVGIWPSPNKTVAGYVSLLGWAIAGYFIPGIGLRKAFWWIVGGVGGDLFCVSLQKTPQHQGLWKYARQPWWLV